MLSARDLIQRVNADEIVTGVLVTDHLWPDLVEMLQRAGLDYMIVDLEHGAFEMDLVANVCAIGRMIGLPVLVRPIDCQYATIRRTVDLGPCGLLLPGVEHPDQLDQVREGVWMPPRGKRRPGGAGNRWVADFNYPTWKREVEDRFIVLPQIETREGLARVDAIAAHPLVTAIAVGPYDLSASLGVCWQPDAPALREALARIRQAGQGVDKRMWMIGHGPALVEEGYTFLCVAEPMGLLQQALKTANEQVKEGTGEAAAASEKPLP